MKLSELLNGIVYKCDTLPDEDVSLVTDDSRKVCPGSLFVCYAGEKSDGHDYAAAAEKAGCCAVLAERQTDAKVPHIIVKDSRAVYPLICVNFFGNPAKRLKLVGITGTNGKTTTAFLIKHILEENGHKSGLIGTIQNMAGDEVLPSHFTTPEPFELHSLFKKMVDSGCEYAVMEVSSQALAQHRAEGLHFAAAVFTNLTQDHLDYHKTMENYLKAKQTLFKMCDKGIINLDDQYAGKMIEAAECKVSTYSAKNMNADYTARNIRMRSDGVDYEIVGMGIIGRVMMGIPGSFSVMNSLASIACTVSLGLPLKGVIDALKSSRGVKGRIEVVPTGRDFTVIIDYAHSPDALEKILNVINGFKKGRLVALFGCGGDRDKTKRPIMGKIAANLADYMIVTSDNPRTEKPSAIIDDILEGVKGTKTPYKVVENRKEAIGYALKNAQKDDIILLAGKGHEDYQVLGKEKIHFDEREVVAEILKTLSVTENA